MTRTAVALLPDRHQPAPARPGRPELRVVDRLLEAGDVRRGTALPAGATRAAEDGTRAGVEWAWPVPGPLQDLLPSGALRRGTAVAVLGSTSLLFATISAASIAGAWIALVGMPNAGVVAAAEHGISVDRLAHIPYPGADWPQVVAALVDGVDLVVAQPAELVDLAVARRLAARVRQRGAVLLSTRPFPGAEATLQVTAVRWCGLGAGRGRLRSRQVTVAAHGPGRLTRPRAAGLWLPAPDGAAVASTGADLTGLARAAVS